jgi:hypothetical protein
MLTTSLLSLTTRKFTGPLSVQLFQSLAPDTVPLLFSIQYFDSVHGLQRDADH